MSYAKPQEKLKNSSKTTDNSYEKRIYPDWIVDVVQSIDLCPVSTVRVRSDGMIECILCNYKIPQTHIEDLKQHVAGKAHTKKVEANRDILQFYHSFWRRMKRDLQEKQFQFKFLEDRKLECHLCHTTLLYKNVTKHLGKCTARLPEGTIYKFSICRRLAVLQFDNFNFDFVLFLVLPSVAKW